MTTNVRIVECTDPAGLYRHYDGKSEPQGTYIELDLRNGILLADWDAEIGGGRPFSVYYGFDRRYNIPLLTGEAANRVMREIAPLADRILADWEPEWDGSNHVACLGEDAQAAEGEIEKKLGLPSLGCGYGDEPNQGFADSDLITVWNLDSATNACEVADYDITAETADERLSEIEQEIITDLLGISESSVAVCHGLGDYLRNLRDELRRAAAEDV